MQEKIIMQSTNNVLTLTSERVIYNAERGGDTEYMSIPLDQVSHSGLKTTENRFIAALAAVATLWAVWFVGAEKQGGFWPVLVAAVLWLLFIITKQKRLVITSTAGGEISARATANREEIIEFLKAIEKARLEKSA